MKKVLLSVLFVLLTLFSVFAATEVDWNNTSVTLTFSNDGTQLKSLYLKYQYHDYGSANQHDWHNIVFLPSTQSLNTSMHYNTGNGYTQAESFKAWKKFGTNPIYNDALTTDNGQVQLPCDISGEFLMDDADTLAKLDPDTDYKAYLLCSYQSSYYGTFYTGIAIPQNSYLCISDNANYRYSANFHFNGFGGTDFTLPVKKNVNINNTAISTNSDYANWDDIQKNAVDNNLVKSPVSGDGLTFDGWYTDAALTVKADFTKVYTSTYHPTDYYAKWTVSQTENSAVDLKDGSNTAGVLTFPNATVSGRVRTMSINVTNGTIKSTTGALATDINSTSATYQVEDAAAAQTLLRSIEFTVTNDNFTITVEVDGNYTSIPSGTKLTEWNGHYYLYTSGQISWSAAYNQAKTMTYMGKRGYLATLSDTNEYNAIRKVSTNGSWVGATVLAYANQTKINDEDYITQLKGTLNYLTSVKTRGANNTAIINDYYWACGPEAGTTINSALKTNTTEPNGYHHTSGWPTENDVLGMTYYECCLVANNGNQNYINDLVEPGDSGLCYGYFVEFGGYAEGLDPGKGNSIFTGSDSFTYSHTHDWKYKIAGNSLIANCDTAFCNYHSPSPEINVTLYSNGIILKEVLKSDETEISSDVEWTSSNEDVATVDSNGKVLTHTNGTTTITAKDSSGTGTTKSITVNVTNLQQK